MINSWASLWMHLRVLLVKLMVGFSFVYLLLHFVEVKFLFYCIFLALTLLLVVQAAVTGLTFSCYEWYCRLWFSLWTQRIFFSCTNGRFYWLNIRWLLRFMVVISGLLFFIILIIIVYTLHQTNVGLLS